MWLRSTAVSQQRIGELLVARGVVESADLDLALESSRSTGSRVASQLLALGIADEGPIIVAVSDLMGTPGVDLSRSAIDLGLLSLFPRDVAQLERILPLRVDGDELLLATADPRNQRLNGEVELISGLRVLPVVALASRLDEVVAAAYTAAARGESLWVGEALPSDTAAPQLALHPGRREPGAREPAARAPGAGPEIEIEIEESEERLDDLFGSGAPPEELVGRVRARSGPRSVLVVDDEEGIIQLVQRTLEKKGYEVQVARRGREALEKLDASVPDLVLLDANLPEVHGFDLCQKIKSNSRLAHIPVIMITAHYRGWRFAHDTREAFGADDFLEKPFRLDDLLRRVQFFVEKSVGEPADQKAAEQAYEEGVRLLADGRVPEAMAALEKGLELDPFSARLHYQLGRALQAAGDAFRAINAYERSVDLWPDHFAALRSLAALYQQKGFRRKAIETWERAIPAAPDEATRQKIKSSLFALL